MLPQHRCFHWFYTPALAASCSITSACHYLYFPAAPALLPLRAPPPKVMTSALWNEEWVILEKQLSLDWWQQELGCCIAQFPGAATKSGVESVAVPKHRARTQDRILKQLRKRGG